MPPPSTNPTARIAIVGAGQVGGAVAYALILGSVACELLLIDVKVDLRDGQVRDLSDVAYATGGGMRVRAATHHEAGQCDIVVITAGSKYGFGETSIQHMQRNISVIRNVVKAMTPFRSDAIVLVVSNPVDLLTSIVQELAGLPKSQVFGSGTFLDSVRLRGLLADKAGVAANSIQLFVLGVHGDCQVVAWSSATIHGIPLDKVLSPDGFSHDELAQECKERAENIFHAKGATQFGVGSVVASICASILFDKRDVRPISHFQPEFGCCFSLPVILGRKGIIKTIKIPLGSEENAAIARSAERLKSTLERIDT
ncbi:lactate dehydrogenase/glycoside hydrolase [Triangularia verruculosa]|uniref:Lactate dehydrogenase/glycoside hydrolase n=1 Tax=Triangularia verruculosa TaxID=2587418 RepID=A0AAN6XEQ3_9PEZI|nr:lactate dehydrogenase/glycoside hydrolase [Triangularia verruculosa]